MLVSISRSEHWVMKKRFGLPIVGVLFGCGFAAPWIFAARQQTFQALPSQTRQNLTLLEPLNLAQIPVAEAKVSTEVALSTQDEIKFQRVMNDARDRHLYQRPIGEVMQAIAEQLLDTPYQENLLDESPNETLTISLQKFDCVLFIESVLAMARGVAKQDYSASTYVNHVREQRYANGEMNGYCSRLHYFSEWLADNQKRAIVKNLTSDLAGISIDKTLNFMSVHWQTYPQLAHSKANRQCIAEMESKLDNASIRYIPTQQIQSQYAALEPGDVIAIATKIPGLDVTHTGLVYRSRSGKLGMIHAAPVKGVMISPDLQRYVAKVDDAIGILVARPIDPRTPQNHELTSVR